MTIDGISLGEVLVAGRGASLVAEAYAEQIPEISTTETTRMALERGLPSGSHRTTSRSMLSAALHAMEQDDSASRKRTSKLTAELGGANDTTTLALLKAESIAREVKSLMLAKCIQKLDEHCNTLLKTGG